MQKQLKEKEAKMRGLVERESDGMFRTRARDMAKMREALSVQDLLREKSKGWNGTRELRKWRQAR